MAFPVTPARKLLLPGSSAVARMRAAAGFDLIGAGDFFSGLWQLIKAKVAELVAYLATLFSALACIVCHVASPCTRGEPSIRTVKTSHPIMVTRVARTAR